MQSNEYSESYKVLYAGSSAHEAMKEASKHISCRVRLFKNGKKVQVFDDTEQFKKQPSKGSGGSE